MYFIDGNANAMVTNARVPNVMIFVKIRSRLEKHNWTAIIQQMSLDQLTTGSKVNECVADTRWLECSIIWFCMKQNVELKLKSGSDHWISIWILWF